MPTQGFTSWTFIDYDGEKSEVSIRNLSLSAANWAARETARNALTTALEGVSLGLLHQVHFGNNNLVALGKATDLTSQRELKWLVRYHDNSSLKHYTLSIPCADASLLDPARRGFADKADAAVIALFTALEGAMMSPTGGSVTVDDLELVGRAL